MYEAEQISLRSTRPVRNASPAGRLVSANRIFPCASPSSAASQSPHTARRTIRCRRSHEQETQAPPEALKAEAVLMAEEAKPEKVEPRRWNDDNRFKSIRGHIAELIQSGDESRANALRKIIVRLDRIEGKKST